MNDLRRAASTTPRRFVVGLLVLGAASACRRQEPAPAPTPVPSRRPAAPPAAPPRSALTTSAALVRAMRDRYDGKWYRTLTFVQKTTIRLPSGGQVVQTWHEALQVPGRLRIETDRASKTGTLFARDSVYAFNSGKLVRADTGLNDLLVLGFDVYAMTPERAERVLRRLGFDLSRMHEDTWQGTPVYVVGAARGDTVSKQFWIERDRLLFVRMLQRTRRGYSDTRFGQYVAAGNGWLATRVEQFTNGRRSLLEEYSDVRVNVDLPASVFDPGQWTTAPRWPR